MTASFSIREPVLKKNVQEKVYHPPPPGKGKNAQQVEEDGEAGRAEPVNTTRGQVEQPVVAS